MAKKAGRHYARFCCTLVRHSELPSMGADACSAGWQILSCKSSVCMTAKAAGSPLQADVLQQFGALCS